MKIEYIIPSNLLDSDRVSDYFRKYVQPLGRGRTTIRIVDGELFLESNRPGLLVLAVRLINIAFGLNWEYVMEPLQHWTPPGGWYGDMEPDTPEFSLMRDGPPLRAQESFVYEPTGYKQAGSLEPVSSLAIGIIGSIDSNHGFYLKADANSLISLAKHFFYLSQPEVPMGENRVYLSTFEHNPKASRLRVVLSEFRRDVPWDRDPSGSNSD